MCHSIVQTRYNVTTVSSWFRQYLLVSTDTGLIRSRGHSSRKLRPWLEDRSTRPKRKCIDGRVRQPIVAERGGTSGDSDKSAMATQGKLSYVTKTTSRGVNLCAAVIF